MKSFINSSSDSGGGGGGGSSGGSSGGGVVDTAALVEQRFVFRLATTPTALVPSFLSAISSSILWSGRVVNLIHEIENREQVAIQSDWDSFSLRLADMLSSALQKGQEGERAMRGLPVSMAVEETLFAPIFAQQKKLDRELMGILFSRYHLLDHFTALRSFFFMEAGYLFYEFTELLFRQVLLLLLLLLAWLSCFVEIATNRLKKANSGRTTKT
jgi:hypothetical protein